MMTSLLSVSALSSQGTCLFFLTVWKSVIFILQAMHWFWLGRACIDPSFFCSGPSVLSTWGFTSGSNSEKSQPLLLCPFLSLCSQTAVILTHCRASWSSFYFSQLIYFRFLICMHLCCILGEFFSNSFLFTIIPSTESSLICLFFFFISNKSITHFWYNFLKYLLMFHSCLFLPLIQNFLFFLFLKKIFFS